MSLVINGQSIDESIIEAEFGNIKAYFETQGNVSCCERDDEFRGYAQKNVIARMLLAEEAVRRTEAPAEAEIDAEVAKIKAEQGAAQFDFMAGAVPEHLENLRRDVALGLRVNMLLAQLNDGQADPTEEELRTFYESNQPLFIQPTRVRASHISKNPGRGDREEIYQALCDVRRQILAGADFDEMARQHSDKGAELIDLNFFTRGELPEEFETVTFSMQIGELSPVFSSTSGFHIAKVTDRKDAAIKPFDEVHDEVRTRWLEQRRQEKTQSLVRELESKATIEMTPEDSETAPV